MTQENKTPTVEEMNIVIADFMGYYYSASKFYARDNYSGGSWFKTAKYHCDWGWIMPVWIKFRSLGLTEHEYLDWLSSLSWYLYSSDSPKWLCERLYYAIQWYNQLKQTNDTKNNAG